MTDEESVWAQVAREHPYFTRAHDAAGNHHAVREIVLGGSVTWAGVWRRFTPGPEMRIMDVGANAGLFSAFCAAKGARVRAYEPFLKAFNLLVQAANCIEPRKLFPIHAAVWIETGLCLYLGNESMLEDSPACNGSLHSDGINWVAADWNRTDLVPCFSFDDALGTAEWDMVKMDIEGSECEVLLMASVEKLKQIKFMYLEFHPWSSQALYDETIKKLESVFHFEGAYWNLDVGRWEAVYLTRRA